MSMYTRCPHCDTHFRVSREQLQASSGQVRCGRCQQPFDAFATLTSQPSAAPESGNRRPVPTTSASAAATPRDSHASGLQPFPAPLSAPDERTTPSVTKVQVAPFKPSGAGEAEPLSVPDHLFGWSAPRRTGGRSWLWTAGTLALILTLLAQTMYLLFATDLAVRLPQVRTVLAEVCLWLRCTVALPRIPDQLFIEASDLQVLDAARPSEVLLTGSIRNHAQATQELPLIELTLTDNLNQTAARKVFYPADYLDRSQDPSHGIDPNHEMPIKLYLDTGDVRPAGYRLYLFFA
jgi:predicted Zn finger-like uncharacterized protein